MKRLNRLGYFWRMFVVNVVAQIIAVAGANIHGRPNFDPAYLIEGTLSGREEAVIPVLALTLGFVIGLFFVVRRFHDLDRSGLYAFGLLVPLYNLYLGIILLFKKGTAGENRFGSDPLASA